MVVATHDRAASLDRLLAALETQTLGGAEFEVVVVDDGSQDDTAAVLSRFAERTARPLRCLRSEHPRGPAAARNLGWRAARAPIIAFTDDDCIPDPGWLAAGLARFGEGIAIVQGRTLADAGAAGYGEHFSRTMEVREEDEHYPTCNIFYRREALGRVDGFDEVFRYACGEDTDLAWRVKAVGYSSRFSAEASVTHEVRPPSFRSFLRERRRFADQILVVKRHPHLRRLYYRRYFYQRSHVHALGAIALVAGASLWAPAAFLLPVVWLDRFRHTHWTGGWTERGLAAGKLLVGDFWELSVFGYWSLRHRTLLL